MAEYVELLTNYLKIQAVQAILCIIISILAAKLADWIIGRILSKLVSRTSSTIDDKIIQILHRPIYYSKSAQSQKIKFNQSYVFNIMHIKLGD